MMERVGSMPADPGLISILKIHHRPLSALPSLSHQPDVKQIKPHSRLSFSNPSKDTDLGTLGKWFYCGR